MGLSWKLFCEIWISHTSRAHKVTSHAATEDQVMSESRRLELEYAIIEDATVFVEDHGIKTFYLMLAYEPPNGASHQGAGGYILDRFNKKLGRRVINKRAMEIVPFIAKMFDVKDWKKLKGQGCYALHSHGGVQAIRNWDKWLDFGAFFDARCERKLVDLYTMLQRYPDIHFDGCSFGHR